MGVVMKKGFELSLGANRDGEEVVILVDEVCSIAVVVLKFRNRGDGRSDVAVLLARDGH